MHSEPPLIGSAAQSPPPSERQTRARERIGTLVAGRWRLDELLGVGGMAAVYAATHRNGRRAALKILHPTLAQVTDVRERFLDEGYVANRIGHPGTVAVLDDGRCADGAHFLVMDLLEGETLEERLTRAGHCLPAREVLALAAPLLEVLAAAHDKGIVHRDIKPENVFLTTSGEIKLLDFGIARLDESPRPKTQAGLTLGTPPFMAPEQARGRWDEVDARTDLWAVGATMFTLLTGRYVHEAETHNEALLAAMSRTAPRLAKVAPHVPRAVTAIVDRALAFSKNERFENAEAMLVAVVSAQLELAELEGRPPPVPRAGETIPSVPFAPVEAGSYQGVTLLEGQAVPRRRKGRALAAGALMGAALLGAGLQLYAERSAGPVGQRLHTAQQSLGTGPPADAAVCTAERSESSTDAPVSHGVSPSRTRSHQSTRDLPDPCDVR